jgi:hypothetical protein
MLHAIKKYQATAVRKMSQSRLSAMGDHVLPFTE